MVGPPAQSVKCGQSADAVGWDNGVLEPPYQKTPLSHIGRIRPEKPETPEAEGELARQRLLRVPYFRAQSGISSPSGTYCASSTARPPVVAGSAKVMTAPREP